jgi:hypothetical protein
VDVQDGKEQVEKMTTRKPKSDAQKAKCPFCDGEGWFQTRATGGGIFGVNMLCLLGLASPCLACGETGTMSKGRCIVLWPVAFVHRAARRIAVEWGYRRLMRERSRRP